MTKIVLKAENLSKQYRLGLVGTGTVKDDFKRWWYNMRGKEDPFLKIGDVNDRSTKGLSEYVWALRDINFEVKQGESVGIIGKNGAGKSTLLKIMSQITSPTTGKIFTKGRIASLLEVGTGFHGELTGRENIFLNGAILGMRKAEIQAKLDEIIDFSGVERYIDTPVKRYSSGMYVRLAFAVAAHLDPDILIVDEVLAVGDAEFQKKAIGKMQDISRDGQGRTVLFVSHNMAAVNDLCSRAIILSNGIISNSGNVKETIELYLSSINNVDLYREWSNLEEAPGNEFIKIRKMYTVNSSKKKAQYSLTTELIGVYIEYIVLQDTAFFTHGINVYTSTDLHLLSSHDSNAYDKNKIIKKGVYNTIVWLPNNILQAGDYIVSVAFMTYNPFKVLFNEEKLLRFQIIDTINHNARPKNVNDFIPGLIRPKLIWEVRNQINKD